MEYTTFIVDGQTLVDNIHSIKQWVYVGLIRVHIPFSSVEAVNQLYKKSLEPKESPKDDRQQKRQSGRPRKEYPLFDINPRTAKEFLERAKSENGVEGVTFQQPTGEEFTQWKEKDEKVARAEPLAPPSSFSEALLRKLNIAQPDDDAGSGNLKPKLVAKSSHLKSSPFKYVKVPTVSRNSVPEAHRSFFSAALWKIYECENNPLEPEMYAVLVQNSEIEQLARRNELPTALTRTLHAEIRAKLAKEDTRDSIGMVEADFPGVPRREIPVVDKLKTRPTEQTNGQLHSYEEIEKRLEATALSAVEELLGGLQMSTDAPPEPAVMQLENLRPSISYAMAAGAQTRTPSKTVSPLEPAAELQSTLPKAPSPVESSKARCAEDKATKDVHVEEDDASSDEEVVLFVGKKRRSQEVSRGVSRPVSRPATAAGSDKVASPKPAKTTVESTLKPQSPVFTPGQLYTPTSPTQQSIHEVYPTPVSKGSSPVGRTSPLKHEGAASPKKPVKAQNTSRTRSMNGQVRNATQEAAQRQSEMILQRQREAIQRSAQLHEAAMRAQAESKIHPREIEMSPTTNPVVIDPDDFGRDYTIRANTEHANGRGKGGGRRGGRGRGAKPQPQPQPQPHQHTQPGSQKKEVDFVLKSGAPRGSARGRGKLWVP